MNESEHRRVGVEVEFSGLEIERVGELLATALDGKLDWITPHEGEITSGAFDEPLRLEVDFQWLLKLSAEQIEARRPDQLRQLLIDLLDATARAAVPLELVSPPLDPSQLERFASLMDTLADAGAEGTQESLAYAFGVHFNPELPEPSVTTILPTVQAFVCLYESLKQAEELDWSRRLTPYVDPFPEDYQALLLAPDYQPDLVVFTEDYLRHNATRNRALDLLPLLAHLGQEDLIESAVNDDRINARPTFHYRLPNSGLGDPDWRLLDSWQRWRAVETLASDEDDLERFREAKRAGLSALPLSEARAQARSMADSWLNDH